MRRVILPEWITRAILEGLDAAAAIPKVAEEHRLLTALGTMHHVFFGVGWHKEVLAENQRLKIKIASRVFLSKLQKRGGHTSAYRACRLSGLRGHALVYEAALFRTLQMPNPETEEGFWITEREAFYYLLGILVVLAVVLFAGFLEGQLLLWFTPAWDDPLTFVPLVIAMVLVALVYKARRRRRNVIWSPLHVGRFRSNV